MAVSLAGRTILVRADLENGLTDDIGPAIADLAKTGARIAVIAGYGNPQGDINPAYSLRRFVKPLEEATGKTVLFVSGSVGLQAEAGLYKTPEGSLVLLENLRFHPDERRNSRSFAMRLSVLGDYFTVTGRLPNRPLGWIAELAAILPSPANATPN